MTQSPPRQVFALAVAIGLLAETLAAQTPMPVTIAAAVDAARRDDPAAIESSAKAAAAAAEADEVETSYLPRADALFQVNRASRNNVFGLLLPQNIIPAISGPVLGTDNLESAWGSAAGLLFSVEAVDFGRRAALVRAARLDQEAGEALAEAARLDAGARAADAFLAALGADQALIATRANVERLEVFYKALRAQVEAALKPGADQSRLEAELAAARNVVIAAEQAQSLARLRLTVAMGLSIATITLEPGRLLDLQPGPSTPSVIGSGHPLVRAAESSAKATEARVDSIERQYRPRIFFNAAISARASGANVDGTLDNSSGLMPDVPNWAAGLTISFPFFDRPATRARAQAAAATGQANRARLAGATLRSQEAAVQASIMTDAALRIAANIPVQLQAAQQSDRQARARYEAGLTGITEVADTQRLLARAETEAALATLAIWRARLAQAVAAGDLEPFLSETATPSGPRIKP